MDYSETVNLPDTNFSMKANLSDNEPERLQSWQNDELYETIQDNREGSETFILHDGPPYANGDIHIGHVLNKVLKDILVKYKTMQGFHAPYRPGWDCHGLPIEHKVTSEQPETVEEGTLAIREACRNYALKYVDIQKEQFRRLGVLGEWDDPYLTLSPDYEAEILRSFKELHNQDYIYRQLKPVHWCWDCETALAEAEVEYDQLKSPAIYVDFNIIKDPNNRLESDETNIMIWTTTPWTLPANVSVAVHPDYTYVEFKDPEGTSHIVAEPLLVPTVNRRNWSTGDITILQKIPGTALKNIHYERPLREDATGKIVTSDIVTLEQGTGCVHMAPGHGQEDYAIGQEHDLPVKSPVNNSGEFTEAYAPEEGTHVLTAQDNIVEVLEKSGELFFEETIEHSYPFCWRCGKPIIFRATPQWFLDVDHEGLRTRILDELDNIDWIPERGRKRFESMVEDRPDWCLSRQRAWGVPIPAIQCTDCEESILDESVMDQLIEIVKDNGVDEWFESSVDRFLPADFECPECGGSNFQTGEDILDVWFDSGISHRAVVKNDPDQQFPADVYLEGSDQHRGWFQLSMIPSVALEDTSPFKELVTHGFVVDSSGEKMSKSKGNVVSPQEIISSDGADILRLWVASEDYHEDLVMGEELLDQVRDKYRRIRNTFKFFLGNLRDFEALDSDTSLLNYGDLEIIDRWFLSELYGLIKRVSRKYEDREFHQAFNEINTFCAIEASSLYIDISKDRLYCENQGSQAHKSALTTLRHGLTSLAKIVAPVLSFTADEVWDYVPGDERVHETDWPDPPETWSNDELIDDFDKLKNLRQKVSKAIEQAEGINDTAEANVDINYSNKPINKYKNILEDWLIVSDVTINDGASENTITVEKTENTKCQRCWRYRSSVKSRENFDNDSLCDRCFKIITSQKPATSR